MDSNTPKKKWYRPSNLLFYSLLLLAISTFIFPDVKAFIINNLMKIGLFQPSIKEEQNAATVNLYEHQDLGFRDESGNTINSSQLQGKIVILNFWATWCPPCRAELPSMNQFYKQWSNDTSVVLIMIDADNKIKESNNFLRQKQYSMKNYISWTRFSQEVWSGSMPTTVVFDKSGKLVFTHTGAMDFTSDKFNNFIKSLK